MKSHTLVLNVLSSARATRWKQWKQFTSVWEGENTLSLETHTGAGQGWRSAWESQPARLGASGCTLQSPLPQLCL